MADDGGSSMAVEVALLRGDMREGFARLEGQLGVLVQSDAQRRSDIQDLERRVGALEDRRIPVGLLATVSGVISAVVAAGAFLFQL